MTMRTNLTWAALAAVLFSLPACGGKIDGNLPPPGDDATTPPEGDAVSDAPPPLPDGSPDGMVCPPGVSWKVDCNTCTCNADGSGYGCTTIGCPPPPPPPPTCPTSIPYGLMPCASEGLACSYSSCPDGSKNVNAYCKGGVWSVSTAPCVVPPPPPPPPSCPRSEPAIGTACGATVLKCSYPNHCGGTDDVYCPGVGGVWTSAGSSCSSPTCPSTEPTKGTRCPAPGAMKCAYTNGCGGSDVAYCDPSGTWSVMSGGCTTSCPAVEPFTGQSCAGYPGGTTCSYPPGSSCPQPCVCGVDGKWTCYTVMCPVPPPGLDAGAPPGICAEGAPCPSGIGCTVGCGYSCYCGSDGVFHCTTHAC